MIGQLLVEQFHDMKAVKHQCSLGHRRKPSPRSSYDDLRTGADKEFAKWWGSSNPPELMAFLKLERNEARFV
jgi:hypothetical protein